MADFEIVRESADGFTHQGHSVTYTDAYIKIRRSFKQHLKRLRGVRLHVFMFISLSETPPDVLSICDELEYHSASICSALDYLVARRFVEELPRVGSHGIKRYRHISFAWDGPDRTAPADVRISENEIRDDRVKAKSENQKTRGTTAQKRNTTTRKADFDANNSRPPHDMNDDSLNHQALMQPSIHEAETREIFAESGIEGKNLDLLARTVSPEVAQAWADWLTAVNRTLWTRPEGFCVKKLLGDKQTRGDTNARPPYLKPLGDPKRARRPVITGKLAGTIQTTWYDEDESELIQR